MEKFRTGGKPSTWFPPGGLVEHISDDQNYHKLKLSLAMTSVAAAAANSAAVLMANCISTAIATSALTSDLISYSNLNSIRLRI